ncbi:MAG: aminotransferase class IV, partial [Pyrinomonadaceae bacterium]
MHRLVIHNHELTEAANAQLSVLAAAALYGRGVFTTLAVRGGRPFLWPQHWARLKAHAERLGIAHAEFAEAEAHDSLLRLLGANGVEEGRARLSLLAGGAIGGVWKIQAREHAAA